MSFLLSFNFIMMYLGADHHYAQVHHDGLRPVHPAVA